MPRHVVPKFCFDDNFRSITGILILFFCTSLCSNITTYLYSCCYGNNHKNVAIYISAIFSFFETSPPYF